MVVQRVTEFTNIDVKPQPGCYHRRTKLEIYLLVVSTLATVACVGLAIALVWTQTKLGEWNSSSSGRKVYKMVSENNGTQVVQDICATKQCAKAAGSIIKYMDTRVDPCNDFYKYACGRWTSDGDQFNKVEDKLYFRLHEMIKEPINDKDPLPLNQAKTFVYACSDLEQLEKVGLDPLIELLNEFGGWPMTMSSWDEKGFDWLSILVETSLQTSNGYLINVYVGSDSRNNNYSDIWIDQPTLRLPTAFLLSPGDYRPQINAYINYISTTAWIVANHLQVPIDITAISKEVMDVVNFEIEVANLLTPDKDRANKELLYNPMSVAALTNLTQKYQIHWLGYLNTLFEYTGQNITSDTILIVSERQYLCNLIHLISVTNPRTVANYMLWRVVSDFGDETTEAMRNASFEFNVVTQGSTDPPNRMDTCLQSANSYFGMAMGIKYVDEYFSHGSKQEINVMVDDIHEAFKEMLQENNWMDSVTKQNALDKLQHITRFIAYPDWFENETAIENYYVGLDNITEWDHFENYWNIMTWLAIGSLSGVGLNTDKYAWTDAPTTVNAYYTDEINSISFPAGILQPPFYTANSLHVLNYGGIGGIIGHETTHGFDDNGRQYDKDGNLKEWWTNDTLQNFYQRDQCIIQQYDHYRVPEIYQLLPNATVNGEFTQSENIADNGGLREAYRAYQRYLDRNGAEARLPGLHKYTNNQMFFLAMANLWCGKSSTMDMLNQILTDVHSPNRYRVIGILSNMQEFADNWNCPVGSPMNPAKKCIIW